MGRFSTNTRRKQASCHGMQRFIIAVTLVLVFGIIYRSRLAVLQTENVITGELFQNAPSFLNSSDRSLPESKTTENDTILSALSVDHTELQRVTIGDQPPQTEHEEEELLDPCIGRPHPEVLPLEPTRPPILYFLHIPKTAGTLMHHLTIRYALKTNGLPCQYTYDGNRFGPEDYHLSLKPPPPFANGSLEQQAVDAIEAKDKAKKLDLLRDGSCRAMRGHVTYKPREYMPKPIISLTVLRDPIERLISMYEFAMMMVRTRPRATGWDDLITGDLQADFRNSSSILNHGFYDSNGEWKAKNNVAFSFHFYGVLHQLSGINPVFEGDGIPEEFRMSNAPELAEKAKDNICSTHILGDQGNISALLDLFYETLAPYSNWTDVEIASTKKAVVNRNSHKNETEESWPESMRAVIRKRYEHEMDVYNFGLKVIAYRKQLGVAH